MTGRRSTFVPSVPSQEHIEEAARLYKAGSAYADSDDLDYNVDTRRPPLAPILAVIIAAPLAATAVALWTLYLVGVHL